MHNGSSTRAIRNKMVFLDCTLRDGGYYNEWDFSTELINKYLEAMLNTGVDVVELGFRTLRNEGFLGACAFTSDDFIRSLNIPKGLSVSVMVNGAELVGTVPLTKALEQMFPSEAADSPVDLVRFACHTHEFGKALEAVNWLKKRGYKVGFNLMQIADRSEAEVKALVHLASKYELDVLYFADSLGSMKPDQAAQIIQWLRSEWKGPMGIHTHDNLGLALSNTLRAINEGVTWVDSTVTGTGRGPGNARTEELAIEIAEHRAETVNMVPLMVLINEHFLPMQKQFGWGTNPYYYLAGKYGIHPTYIQEMLGDSRYSAEDVLSVIMHLKSVGGKKFLSNKLDQARNFYLGELKGDWAPLECFSGREVLLLGAGPSVYRHRDAIERYVRNRKPVVLALNVQSSIAAELIDLRVACHPMRLLADCNAYSNLHQPLIAPYSMLPKEVRESLAGKLVLDFGLNVKENTFSFEPTHCTLPSALVVGYALAIATSGQATRIMMAGFDGYGTDDPRSLEMYQLLEQYQKTNDALPLISITPSTYRLYIQSVYSL